MIMNILSKKILTFAREIGILKKNGFGVFMAGFRPKKLKKKEVI